MNRVYEPMDLGLALFFSPPGWISKCSLNPYQRGSTLGQWQFVTASSQPEAPTGVEALPPQTYRKHHFKPKTAEGAPSTAKSKSCTTLIKINQGPEDRTNPVHGLFVHHRAKTELQC